MSVESCIIDTNKKTDYPTVNSLSGTDIKKIFENLLYMVRKFIRIT